MLSTSTHTIAKLLQVDIGSIEQVNFTGVYTDTREPMQGGLFIALIGENFDAHNYIDKAKEMGAVAILACRHVKSTLPVIQVADTQLAMAKIATWHRDNIAPTVVAITGSNGKTTTKNMLKNILSLKAPTLATQGNLNNHLGVPMTLLRLKKKHQYAVIEMGANHLGEINRLRQIAKPDVAVVTNTGDAHIGEFGGFENLVKAKGEIFSPASKNIVNTKCQYQGDIYFGNNGDVFATNLDGASFELNFNGEKTPIKLSLLGMHNIENALAASACAFALGIDSQTIKNGLEKTQAEKGRLNFISTTQFNLIDDTYNANPKAMRSALNVLSGFSGEKVAVFGAMAELGKSSKSMHQEIGDIAKKASDYFYSCGHGAKSYNTTHFENLDELANHIKTKHQKATVLIKASRSAHLENLVAKLQK